jgi:hypothetical protein
MRAGSSWVDPAPYLCAVVGHFILDNLAMVGTAGWGWKAQDSQNIL